MAAMKAASTPCLSVLCSPQLYQRFALARNVGQRVIEMSPSLTFLRSALEEKLAALEDIC